MSSNPQEKTSWLPELLSGLAVASGVGFLAASYTLSRWLTRSARRKLQHTPEHLGLTWEALEVRTADGWKLAGWAVTPPQPRGTILLCHGLRQNRLQTLDRFTFLTEAGYRCIAFDHRAHGESTGKRTSFGYHESQDIIAIREQMQPVYPGRWAALGISMGAAAVCFAADRTPAWDAVILEGLYHDLTSAFTNRIGSKYPLWFRKFARGVIWVTEKRLGLRMDQLAPVEHIAKLAPAPVLVLTGTQDGHAPPEDAERLYQRISGPAELWLVPGAGHENVLEKGGEEYQRRIREFLERWLPAQNGQVSSENSDS
jgi:pimeloyl-ACP methyl ester carboxylesterase